MTALLAGMAAVFALVLSQAHPLAPLAVTAVVAGLSALAFLKPLYLTSVLLALLPWIGLMPWTGWIVVEELDLAVLAVAAGGYARLAVSSGGKRASFNSPMQPTLNRRSRHTSLAWLYLLPLAASTLISMLRGLSEAGELIPSWWQGYREPLNSLRLAKPVLEVALLLPLWLAAQRTDGVRARRIVGWGFLALLAGTALGVWWERLAHTGLLNFSSDYRATGTFWEMHVGGAALDALLVAALPFCTVALWRERGGMRWAALAALLALAAYAALVTFSRIVYLAAPVAVGLAWWLQTRQSTAAMQAGRPRSAFSAAFWLLLNLAVVWWLFPVAGYRGLLAWLGVAVLALMLAPRLHRLTGTSWTVGLAGAIAGTAAVAALAVAWPKGAYLAFAAAWALALFAGLRRPSVTNSAVAMAGYLAALSALVAVCVQWGGSQAWVPSLSVATGAALLIIAVSIGPSAAWPDRWQWQALVVSGMAVTAIVAAVFSGGAYMGGRMTASLDDGATRTVHWSRSLSWMGTTDWVIGKGLGRYLSNHVMSGAPEDQVGDLRLNAAGATPGDVGDQSVMLTSGKHLMGFGAMYRLSQRVDMPAAGTATLSVQVRNSKPVDVVVEICEKHLLYNNICMTGRRTLPGSEGAWQKQKFVLTGKVPLSHGIPFAPRMAVFSMALAQPGSQAEFDDLLLLDAAQNSLLVNGSFARGLARWFTSSDHHHMPWHAKNLGVHLLFEQGFLGLLSFALAAAVALWRLCLGAAAGHSLSPALAGGLLGVLVVGAVDSLLDMPRVGFVLWLMLAIALALPRARVPESQLDLRQRGATGRKPQKNALRHEGPGSQPLVRSLEEPSP